MNIPDHHKIRDYPPTSDIAWITIDTPVALQHPCDKIITRTSVADIMIQMNKGSYYGDKITENDRLDLCDIVWYLKGLKAGDNCPFTTQIDTLEKVIKSLCK